MMLLPHLFVLHRIKEEFHRLSHDPEHLSFILCGYTLSDSMTSIYGVKYIDSAISWFQKNTKHINFCLGYRLDMSRIPSVSVMFEGGVENSQFLGDFGTFQSVSINPRTYGSFHAKDVNEDGNLVVPSAYELENKVWRGLKIKRGEVERTIIGLLYRPKEDLILELNAPLSLEDGLDNWKVVSCVSTKLRTVGTSLDKIQIKVYFDVPGDPELCEMLSCVMRAVLKQSRLQLMSSGLSNVTFSYSPLAKNENYQGMPAWTSEYTISGLLTDTWILSDQNLPDKIDLTGSCERTY